MVKINLQFFAETAGFIFQDSSALMTADGASFASSDATAGAVTTFDLSSLNLAAGTYAISVIAKAAGYIDSLPSDAVSYEVVAETSNFTLSDGRYYVTSDGELFEVVSEDELAGTWVINSDRFRYPSITDSYNSSFDLNVTIDGVSYKSIVFSKFISSTDFDDGWIYAYPTDDSSGTTLYAYEPDQHEITTGWVNESYKTWAITSNLADVTNGDALLTWLQANATKQEEAEITNIVINNATYTTKVGMTWADWANSAYNTDSLTLTTPIYGIINSELVSKSSSDPMVEGYYALGASAILFNQDARGDSTSMEIVVTDDKGNVAARANSPVVNGSRAQASAFHNNLLAQIPAGALSYAQTYGEYMTATITTAPVADNQQVKLIAINEYNGVRQIFEGDFSSTSSSITITPEQSHFGITITPITGSSSYNVTQDGGGGDWQYVIIYKSSIISFTIDGTSYTAEEGMTWGEWVASDYNTNGFVESDGSIVSTIGNPLVYNNTYVNSDDVIIYNTHYTTDDIDTSHNGGSN